ncbi:DUF4129 domain-containing protein [Arthrobacter sp. zg-Y1143]|uniref:DUF4129 domain-containing protein n=1 Tax=Arthrobacter sp. zg-Y1143 TaxID=3049065 RepID=UPI0024C3B234|nr:DUF4129 domain-containing protein [Arthrobacter sp. zg-Y1143]MDK1327160.1 DUF4129 domain-containing protein [Arthrobacter sp. zg-Y1143]
MIPTRVPGDVPVDPESDQAREWLSDELSRDVYADAEPGLLQRAWKAVTEWLGDLLDGLEGLDAGPGTLVLALAAAAVAVIVVLIFRPRFSSAAKKPGKVFAQDLIEAAQQHRARAEQAEAAQRWDEALAERFRAMVRSAEERVVFEARPSRTAAEAGAGLASAFPEARTELLWLGRRFDEVMYGTEHASSDDCRRAAALDGALESARPALSPEPAMAAPR